MVAACGRGGFGDEVMDAAVGTTDGSSIDAPPQALACGSPTRFQLGAASLNALSAASLTNGYAIMTTDSSGALRGWAFAFNGSQLVATAQNVALDSGATGVLGAASYGNTLMLTSEVGTPSATGTTVYALDPTMKALATPSARSGQFAATHPIAASGVDGTFAFVTMDSTTGEADAHVLAADGTDSGAPVKIVAGAAVPNNLAIATAPSGYAVAYSSAAGSPRQVTLQLHDASFNTVGGPVAVDSAAGDEYMPSIASAGNALLVTWHAKDATGDDEVWIAIYDSALTPLVTAKSIATFSNDATLASDGTGFWLTWNTYKPANHLAGAHVAVDGTVTPRPVAGTSGTPGKWTLIARDTQPVLVWTEVGGSGPDLYLDPMCGP
jgi:hypothetical protein